MIKLPFPFWLYLHLGLGTLLLFIIGYRSSFMNGLGWGILCGFLPAFLYFIGTEKHGKILYSILLIIYPSLYYLYPKLSGPIYVGFILVLTTTPFILLNLYEKKKIKKKPPKIGIWGF